jgi:hypothetical protein
MSDLIQCELCDVFIDFNDYLNHVRECSLSLNQSLNQSLNSSVTSYNSMINTNNDISSIIGSIDSSLFLSTNSLSESFMNFYRQVINEFSHSNEEGDENDDDEEAHPIFNIRINNTDINIMNNFINGIQNTNNAPATNYQNLSNLEDVKNPVKNIDLVAPLIQKEEVPEDTYCSICQNQISEKVRKTLCNHYYCSCCIEPWLTQFNKTCPSCLANLEDLFKKINGDAPVSEDDEDDEEEDEDDEDDEDYEEEDDEDEEDDDEDDEEDEDDEDDEEDEEEEDEEGEDDEL